MDAKERAAAAIALSHWFESQEISVGDACKVMGDLIGVMIGKIADDVKDMDNGLRAFSVGMREAALISLTEGRQK